MTALQHSLTYKFVTLGWNIGQGDFARILVVGLQTALYSNSIDLSVFPALARETVVSVLSTVQRVSETVCGVGQVLFHITVCAISMFCSLVFYQC